jgi:hypothetical protein
LRPEYKGCDKEGKQKKESETHGLSLFQRYKEAVSKFSFSAFTAPFSPILRCFPC